MTRCEEFSRGEYAPRLLAYFLFLKSLLHEITQENQLKIDPKIPKIKKLKRSLVSHRLDSYSLFLSTRHEEFSKVSSVNGSRTKTTLLLGSSAKSPGIPFFLPRDLRGGKKRIFHDTHVFANECIFVETYDTFVAFLSFESVQRFVISYFYLSWNIVSIFCQIINNSLYCVLIIQFKQSHRNPYY